MTAGRPRERVEVWFGDEARLGQKGTPTAVRADRGTRPTAPEQGAFGHLHVLTAVGPATGEAEGLVGPALSARVAQLFLDQLSATAPAGTHRLRVWDGAGCHVAKARRVPADLTLITLPPYPPESSPAERLWLYLRQHDWPGRVHPTLADLEAAAASGWRATGLSAERIKTVCRCDYLEPGT